MNIPGEHQVVMPYLLLNKAERFLKFAENIFNAQPGHKESNQERGILHAEITIGDTTIMVADSTNQWEAQPGGLFIYAEDVDKTYKRALDHGAESLMEPSDQEYGRSCGIKDPCGNSWWITSAPS